MLVEFIIVGVVGVVAGFVMGAVFTRNRFNASEIDPEFEKRIEEIDERIMRLQVDIVVDRRTGDGKSE